MKPLETRIDFAVGGQAVIEGVMMRSPHFFTIAVRNEAGELKTKQEAFKSFSERFPFLKIPLLRGVLHLVESMSIGIRSLNYSNSVFMGEDEKTEEKSGVLKVFFLVLGAIWTLGSLAFTLFLMKVLPLWIADQAAELWPFAKEHFLVYNAIDGFTKISLFLGYILVISLVKDIRRVFQYHGAEHKSIWAYEKGLDLTVENARKQTRFHPRCGTSFIFIVIVMSVLIYSLFPAPEAFWAKLAVRIAVIPLIAGLSYELLKASAKWQNNVIMKLFVMPGLMFQKLTTKEPDDKQLEVALLALKESLAVEKTLAPA